MVPYSVLKLGSLPKVSTSNPALTSMKPLIPLLSRPQSDLFSLLPSPKIGRYDDLTSKMHFCMGRYKKRFICNSRRVFSAKIFQTMFVDFTKPHMVFVKLPAHGFIDSAPTFFSTIFLAVWLATLCSPAIPNMAHWSSSYTLMI